MTTFIIFLSYLFLVVVYLAVTIFYLYGIYAMIKGAPFVPTNKKRVERVIELAKLKTGDKLIDLGSGDGRIVFAAAKEGANAIGIEINPVLFYYSLWKTKLRKIKNVEFVRKNMWTIDLSDVDVLTLYCISDKMEKLKKKIKAEMRPGSKVISCAFTFPDWQYSKKCGKIYLYEV